MSSQLAVPCPLVSNGNYKNLGGDNCACNIPILRSRFMRENPGQSCTCDDPKNQCLVSALHPHEATHEIHLRVIANQHATRDRVYSNLVSAGI